MKGNASTSAPAVLSAANAMVTLASATVTRTALTSISPEECNDGTPSLPSPLKKTQKTSHQRQIDRQNVRKGKDAYALALSRATTLVAAERAEQEKENARPTATIIAQVEGGVQGSWFCGEIR